MNLFISWSGDRSHSVAQLLNNWVPKVIQAVETWLSSEDIERGTQWFQEIRQQLDSSDHGILCLTPENIKAPWIYFEAGALFKGLNDARLYTILFDLEPRDIQGPLTQFNHTSTTKDSVFKLITSINSTLEKSVDLGKLKEAFDLYWPQFVKRMGEIEKNEKVDKPDVRRSNDDVLDEILTYVRKFEQAPLNGNLEDAMSKREKIILNIHPDAKTFYSVYENGLYLGNGHVNIDPNLNLFVLKYNLGSIQPISKEKANLTFNARAFELYEHMKKQNETR